MKKNHILILILALLISGTLPSCIVSQKKYDALAMEKVLTEDSLSNVIDKTLEEYVKQKNALMQNNARKDSKTDSLSTRLERLTADADELQRTLNETISDYNREKEKLVQLGKKVEEKSLENKALNENLKEKEERLSELEEMIAENKKETEKLRKIIADALIAFDDSELSVYQKDGKVYVSMEEKLLFPVGSAKIDSKGKDAVQKLSEVLGKNPAIDIVIEGHTDNTGSAAVNWKLSTERALSIVKVLEENDKIDPKRISAAGRGMYQPVADNSDPEGRKKNRRIEIILSPKLDSLYELLNE
jgi:chemotaxis protein MotB